MRRKYPAAAGSIYGMCAVGSGRGVEMGLSCGFSDAVKGRIAREDRAYLKERFLPALKRRRVAVCLSGDDRFMACGGSSPLLEVGLSRWTHARCVKRVCLRTEGVVWSGRCSALLEQTRKTGGAVRFSVDAAWISLMRYAWIFGTRMEYRERYAVEMIEKSRSSWEEGQAVSFMGVSSFIVKRLAILALSLKIMFRRLYESQISHWNRIILRHTHWGICLYR